MGSVRVLFLSAIAALLFASIPAAGRADAKSEIDCLACHGALIEGLKTHAAVSLGCSSCHTGIDATEIPHRITNSVKRGLLDDPPRLCYTCHDKKIFANKHVHPALDMGCGSCHSPHASGNNKLLTAPVPELCNGCHDLALTAKKLQHGPVGAGLCLQCHDPHASGNRRLLTTPVPKLCTRCHDNAMFTKKIKHGPSEAGWCLECHMPHAAQYGSLLLAPPIRLCGLCHAAVLEGKHLISGVIGKGHPVGAGKAGGEREKIRDPFRKGASLSCVSCHDPHSEDSDVMVRFPMDTPMDICKNCHTGKF